MRTLFFTSILLFSITIQYAQKNIPDFTVTDVYGHTHTLYADYTDNDKYVFIEFFNTGCQSCQELTPKIDTVFKEFGCNYSQVVFLGIEIYDFDPSVIEFINKYGMNFPAVSGNDGGGYEVFNQFGYNFTPYKILISPENKFLFDNPEINNSTDLKDTLLSFGLEPSLCEGRDFIFYSLLSENDSIVGFINDDTNTVLVNMPGGTDLTNLRAVFVNAVNSEIFIDGVEQISGETVLDFSNGPLIYQIISEVGATMNWTVSVQTVTQVRYLYDHVEMYPNPTLGSIYLCFSDIEFKESQMILNDLSGRQVYKTRIHTDELVLNISEYPAGLYFLELLIDDVKIVKRILKY